MPNVPIPHPSFLDECEKYRVDAGKQIFFLHDMIFQAVSYCTSLLYKFFNQSV